MAASPFDLLLFGRRKIAGASPSHQSLTKARLRVVQQVFNNRRVVYRNRVETNRRNLLISTIESAHNREQAAQRVQRLNVLTDLKRKDLVADSCLTLLPSYNPIDLTEPKDFYRFGVRVQSAGPHIRSRAPKIPSNLASTNTQSRAKSGSTIPRPYTAPLQTVYREGSESDDETIPISVSDKCSTSAVANSVPSPDTTTPTSISSPHYRITWPVQLKVFAVQDEEEAHRQFLAWRAEQLKVKARRSSKQFLDLELERQYQESIRRRKEIEAFVTPDLIEEHRKNDPVFAKRYRQLKTAVRVGETPNYDPSDHDIVITMNKSKIERARTALVTAKQSKIKNFYRNQQIINDANLSKRIDTFLNRLAKLKVEQERYV